MDTGSCVSVGPTGCASRGRGAFAARAVRAGELLVRRERPLRGTLGEALGSDCTGRFCPQCGEVAASPVARESVELLCRAGCGARYCSEACRGAAWASGHRLLCVGRLPTARSPLVRFRLLAAEAGGEGVLLRAGAAVCAAYEAALAGDWAHAAALLRLQRAPWEEVAIVMTAQSDDGAATRRRRAACYAAARQLRLAIRNSARHFALLERDGADVPLAGEALQQLASDRAFSLLAGSLALNDVAVVLGRSRRDVDLDGAAIFSRTVCLNHACDGYANCRVDFPSSRALADVVALRDIASGEELTHTYAPDTRFLSFDCACPACVSSDEEEEDRGDTRQRKRTRL